jgi:hypothetical protein
MVKAMKRAKKYKMMFIKERKEVLKLQIKEKKEGKEKVSGIKKIRVSKDIFIVYVERKK